MDSDETALSGKQNRRCLADAAAGAGNQNPFVLQFFANHF